MSILTLPAPVPAAETIFNDVEPEFLEFHELVQPCTMVDLARMHSLYHCVRYVVARGIPGDFVECGVYRGGCCMLMALALRALGDRSRRIWLYDTFAGMPEPTDEDISVDGRRIAGDLWRAQRTDDGNDWCRAGLDEVQGNMARTGIDAGRLEFVVGRTEDTIPASAPEQIALLRLDTDWHASTAHELEHLFPRLSYGGALISDDYGAWRGHRRAVDEYLAVHGPMLLQRVGSSAVGLKV